MLSKNQVFPGGKIEIVLANAISLITCQLLGVICIKLIRSAFSSPENTIFARFKVRTLVNQTSAC